MSHTIIWEFTVPPRNAAAFERAYGPDGAWAKLFGRGEGFVGVTLLREGSRYLTVDRWASGDDFERFKRVFAADYDALDRELEGLATNEVRIGAFDEVGR